MSAVNPITLEVIRNALVAYADEMATVLRKTAYNMMIYEVQDYCVGLVDVNGGIIAQNSGGLPIFLADLGVAVKDGVDRYGLDGLEPGDVLITNHPYVCGQHLNNVVIYTPFFLDGELVALPAVRAHWIDIGGSRIGFGSVETTEIFQEGLQMRSLKLYKAGVEQEGIFQILRDNIRFPESSFGDLRAQIAACKLGERRLAELFGRYGKETVQKAIEIIWDQSEELCRKEVELIPDGAYEAESFLDNDGVETEKRVPIRVRVVVQGSNFTIDYTEISDQVRGPINSGLSGGMAAARVAFKCVTSAKLPVNEGCFRPLRVILPEGKLVNARPPAALGQWSIPLPTVIDTILKALAPAIPHKIPAAHKGDMGGYAFHGIDPRNGRRYVCLNIFGGGWGGRPFEDGESGSVSVCQGDVKNIPVEMQELYYPLFIEKFSLREDSGGPGKFRGGMGVEMVVRTLGEAKVNINTERTLCPPWGILGGLPGSVNGALIQRAGNAEPKRVYKITNCPLAPGDQVIFETAGGGGYGPPRERSPEKLRQDLERGYVSPEAARRDYGFEVEGKG